MPDIEKLKQEAEKARQNLILCIHVYIDIPERNAGYVADALIAATIKQIALQAAEKEAEAQAEKYSASEGWRDWNGNVQPVGDYTTVDVITTLGKRFIGCAMRFYWGGDDVAERIVRWREMGQASALSANPAPIADDAWIKWHGQSVSAPIESTQRVAVKFRDDGISYGNADSFYWNYLPGDDSKSDIIAYRLIKDDEQGWIKWEGGECPVDEDVRVSVKTRSGNILADGYQRWQWERRNDDRDIIAYRIISPAADRVSES